MAGLIRLLLASSLIPKQHHYSSTAVLLQTTTSRILRPASITTSTKTAISFPTTSRHPRRHHFSNHRFGTGLDMTMNDNNNDTYNNNNDNDADTEHQPPLFKSSWTVCPFCHGEGQRTRTPSRKARLRHKRAKLNENNNNNNDDTDNEKQPQQNSLPPMRIDPCTKCNQTGIIAVNEDSDEIMKHDNNNNNSTTTSSKLLQPLPKVAIIGGGLGGLALAIACQHRQIPFMVYERDNTFSERSQGYGLTMQQASRALSSFGITELQNNIGITSTKHVVHSIDGTVVGEWGLRKWGRDQSKQKNKKPPKRQNIHIARQALRRELLDRVDPKYISWGSKLVAIHPNNQKGEEESKKVTLEFLQGDQNVVFDNDVDLVVGADGIRSTVRQYVINDDSDNNNNKNQTTTTPLRYLDCLVVLGICPLDTLPDQTTRQHELLDGETVFQTADGSTRIYCMPYSKTEYMWQLSFPVLDEDKAKELSKRGPEALKEQALELCGEWHSPIPELLQMTSVELVSGYPVYDRELLTLDMLTTATDNLPITLIGDAAHPMSPFKGQGANQALLDALVLARSIYSTYYHGGDRHRRDQNDYGDEKDKDSNDRDLDDRLLSISIDRYHREMVTRSAKKVEASAKAAQFLHSNVAIQEGNITRGAAAAAAASESMTTTTTTASEK